MPSEPCGQGSISLPLLAQLETRAAEPLAVRIGIATGVVVIGDLSREGALREHAVVGDTPNLAARLQALAEPGTIVVAASTRRLLGDLFRLRDLGRHEVKGIAEPVAAWAVEDVSASESRFEAVRAAASDRSHWARGRARFPAGTPTPRLEGRGADRADLGRAGDRQVPSCGGSRRAHRRRAAYALALSMFALPHQQRASAVHRPVGASGGVQGRRYLRATPRQVGSGPRHGRIAD